MIVVKSPRELELMREAGRLVARVLAVLREAVAPGVTTAELDRIAEEEIRRGGGEPAFKGYRGFPASICTSVNDEVVHGIPSPERVLREGDIVALDVGAIVGGYHGDAAITVPVGRVNPEAQRLIEVTEAALHEGIRAAREGARLGAIGHAVQRYVERHGFSVVRDYAGHGIGRRMHEDPSVPNYGVPTQGAVLRRGMTLAIEPMVNAGGHEVYTEADQWTVRTRDGSLSAHFEHTVAIQGPKAQILTVL